MRDTDLMVSSLENPMMSPPPSSSAAGAHER
jgi:hypothetical protein